MIQLLGWKYSRKEKHFARKQRAFFKKQDLGWENESQIAQSCNCFLKRENFENKTEISDYVFYLEFQLWVDVIISKRVLGIKWDVGNDEFVLRFKKITELAETLEITKRNILMINATFNDTLGFFLD